ncbi:MAG: response regulator [Spirochaetales bacterium]|nr:response regulator [Spirochaetales bacterium]
MNEKILIVDDEPHIVKMVAARLKSLGYTVESAFNGEEGLEKTRQWKPDLIILDVMMPKMDGPTMAAELKEDQSINQIPIIFLTALIKREEDEAQNHMVGGNYFLAKPFDPLELINMVKSVLKNN